MVGHDYSDPSFDRVCPPKQAAFVQTIAYYLNDSSGSGWFLGQGRVERDGDVAVSLGLPSTRLAPGRASLTAVPIGTATPDAAGSFTAEFKSLTVSAGDQAGASQARCDGTSLSATATVG